MRVQSSAIQFGTSPFDRYRALLVSAVLISGLVTGLLALLFILQMDREPQPSPNMVVFDVGYPHEDEPDDVEFEEPKLSDVEEMTHDMDSAVDALTDALSNNPALATSITGDGLGDKRKRPPRGPRGPDISPRKLASQSTSHWVLSFSIRSEKEYLQQVDDLNIELGYVSKTTSAIDYASKVATKTPTHRVGVRADEKRHLFMTSNKITLKWHEKVFNGLGVELDGKIGARFFPDDVIKKMKQLESDQLKKLGLPKDKKIRRTSFGLRRDGEKWEFYVVDIATD